MGTLWPGGELSRSRSPAKIFAEEARAAASDPVTVDRRRRRRSRRAVDALKRFRRTPEQRRNMSWQAYVDDQLVATKMVKHAVISGHDGNIWAQSAGFPVAATELKAVLDKFGNTDQLAQSGVVIGGVKYMYLSSSDKVIRAKKGTNGVHLVKTGMSLICSLYEDPIVPEQAASVTEKLGDYLIQHGY